MRIRTIYVQTRLSKTFGSGYGAASDQDPDLNKFVANFLL
jgi:hypothetical protein